MFNFWIIVFCLGLLATKPINGQSDVEVKLVVPRWVERGNSATFECRHNVIKEILFKVTWLKVDKGKFFEFINGRNPPFRNSSIEGAEIDWDKSNETQVTLKNVQFDLTGQFFCEVSTDTPIYTKASADELMNVYLPQTGPPTIKFRKRTPFAMGEKLFALCNTTRGRPAPHITWLINGKKLDCNLCILLCIVEEFAHFTPHHGHEGHGHHGNIYNNPFGALTNYHDIGEIHEIHQRNYDLQKQIELKKQQQLELKKHRNSNRKYRRHINENALGIIRSTLNNGGFGPQAPSMNKEMGGMPAKASPMNQLAAGYQRPLSHPGGGSGVAAAAAAVTAAQQEKGMFSISQLNLEITEQHVGSNGRMEITCLSTIPATIAQGEQYADYKTYSVKVEVERELTSLTSTAPPSIGMAALGNGNGHGNETSAGWRARSALLTQLWSLSQLLLVVLLPLNY
ncbi:beat-VII [Drosophila busckii]|uniref:Beat-VII n=1 Tax=Drosophila busckii TaxID=30019 RepID=A0A0M5J6V0_DROBS|nr:beat-VII [Drosophila busckii]